MHIEPLVGSPSFLSFGAWQAPGTDRPQEVVSRRRLDGRQVVPFFDRDGERHVGLLRRTRASRAIRGASLLGYEPIGIDFTGVDETGDVLDYERAIFSDRAKVTVDLTRAKLPLPSHARSIGYLAELALPLLVPIVAPSARSIPVTWDGGEHAIDFMPLSQARALLDHHPHAEALALILRAFSPPPKVPSHSCADAARALVERSASKVWSAEDLARAIEDDADPALDSFVRLGDLRGEELRFLRASRVEIDGISWEIITPHTGVSLTIVPYVVLDGAPQFLVWCETRASVLERRLKQPVFDLPIHPRYINATGCFLDAADAAAIADPSRLDEVVRRRLSAAMGLPARSIVIEHLAYLGASEPAPASSSELRHRVACALDASAIETLPGDVRLIAASELRRAIADGRIKDPILVEAAIALGLCPFTELFDASPPRRDAFLETMTHGSIVQRRLQTYSSIEVEQLGAPTYARLMTLLQHEYGVRIAYPRAESDRSFFKAAFRVFMAAERVVQEGDDSAAIQRNRALQGLHWSHDAFHFALGNFTTPFESNGKPAFAEWFDSGGPPPTELPADGPLFETYYEALKAAEDEATFFSFWTLYDEQPSLARHVDKLTYHAALRAIGVSDRAEARAIFDDITHRANLPERVSSHEIFRARADVRGVFEYMLGFRDYHRKDIVTAWRLSSKDPYRDTFLRFDLYDHDLAKYLAHVRGFQARLRSMPPGLNPLACTCADVRVSIALRVWDAVKAMKLARTSVAALSCDDDEKRARRCDVRALTEKTFSALEGSRRMLASIRDRITNAELVGRNELLHEEIASLAAEVESERAALWQRIAATRLLANEVLDQERIRELPR